MMKRKELKVLANEYARAVSRAREIGEADRERIDKRAKLLEQALDEAKKRADAAVEEQLLQNKNTTDKLTKLVDELVKGE